MLKRNALIESLARESAELHTPADTAAIEGRFRDEGLQMIYSMFESLLLNTHKEVEVHSYRN